MDVSELTGLEPAEVFACFKQICAIPHGSRNTKAISDHLAAFATAHGLSYRQDELNNLIIFKPGTAGYENHAPVILQGHMDMVCQKEADCPIDMEKQGLTLRHDAQKIWAEGTTLGGDDGIAVAYAMALLASRDIPHPPLEVLLTVDEEIGMEGAAGVDLTGLRGRTLINIDSEEEGIFTVSCAGGARGTITLPLRRHPVYGPCVRLTVDGLRGGHSGTEIHRNLANANKVMGLLLQRISEAMPLCIAGLSGGSADNAIARSCRATLVALGSHPEQINEIVQQVQQQIRQDYDEPDAVVRADNAEALGGNALSTEDSAALIELLCAVPNGVRAWSSHIPGLVQTSLNLGIAEMHGDAMKLVFAVRSSVNAEKQALLAQLRELAEKFGGSYSQMGEYPAWEYRQDSPLRRTMETVYTEMFGTAPQVVAIHAGLECGLLSEKLPGLDCVSIGPNMHDIHTTRETLEIASAQRTWQFLLEILRRV